MVNNATCDWTPFSTLFKTLFNELLGTVIVITKINADTLYIYIEEAFEQRLEFIFSKSKNTLTAVNQGEIYYGNHQLTKISKGAANKVIKEIIDKWGS